MAQSLVSLPCHVPPAARLVSYRIVRHGLSSTRRKLSIDISRVQTLIATLDTMRCAGRSRVPLLVRAAYLRAHQPVPLWSMLSTSKLTACLSVAPWPPGALSASKTATGQSYQQAPLSSVRWVINYQSRRASMSSCSLREWLHASNNSRTMITSEKQARRKPVFPYPQVAHHASVAKGSEQQANENRAASHHHLLGGITL